MSGNLVNAGTVQLTSLTAQHSAGDKLTIAGNFIGSGGTLAFDTVLGGSGATDVVVINGNLTGTALVSVNNIGGAGALTSGDGIRLVRVDGSSSGQLVLGNPKQWIDVGAFRYQLYLGGIADPSDQDWYLRSRVRDIVVPITSIARQAQDAGLAALGTLNERGAGPEQLSLEPTATSGFLKGMWGRALGSDGHESTKSPTYGDSRSDVKLGGLQMGLDVFRHVWSNGAQLRFGGYAGHLWSGTTDRSTTALASVFGTTRSDGWMTGGYLTYYAPGGFYADAVVQGDWLDHQVSAIDGTSAQTRSRTILASLEVGGSLGSKWRIEPQAQIIYGRTSFDSFSDSAGEATKIHTVKGWTGRVGMRLTRTWVHGTSSDNGWFTLYGKANIWRRLNGDTTTLTIGQSNLSDLQFKKLWGDVGLGAKLKISQKVDVFTDLDVKFGLDQESSARSGRVGVRMRF